MPAKTNEKIPLVYACSGCSNVAQLANYIALELTKLGIAEMSCIAGIGGGVPALVKKARSADYIIALDGCPLQCCKNCLKTQSLAADEHIVLSDLGLTKKHHQAFDQEDADRLLAELSSSLTDGFKQQSYN